MLGEGFCAVDGAVMKHIIGDIPKKPMGTIILRRGQVTNKKIKHSNKTDNDIHYKLVSDSAFIYFRQHSTFEIKANCFTYIRVQIGLPLMYEGPSTEVVNIYLKRKDIDQVEEIYSFIIKVDESDLTQDTA